MPGMPRAGGSDEEATRQAILKTESTKQPLESWHSGGGAEIHFYAQSLQKAAKALGEKLERENARTDWEACPVVLLYRDALKLHLKALVGEWQPKRAFRNPRKRVMGVEWESKSTVGFTAQGIGVGQVSPLPAGGKCVA